MKLINDGDVTFINIFHIPDRPQAGDLRLPGRRRDPVLHGVLAGLHVVLRSEGRRVLRAVVSYDGHGQRVQERRGDDRQTDPDLQQDPPGRHHQGAHRNHLWCRRP